MTVAAVPRELVTAVVLTGGRSTRMGRDKASLVPVPSDGRPLARIVLDALSPVAAHALFAGPPVEGIPDVPAIADENPGAGPLAALARALTAVRPPDGYAVLAACDMPTIGRSLVAHLLDRAAQDRDALCVLCTTDRGLEPLLSVWRPAAAAPLAGAVAAGASALRDGVAAVPHLVVEPHEWHRFDPHGASFVNWNRPEDLP